MKDKLEAVNLILSRKSRPRLMVLIGQGEKRDAVCGIGHDKGISSPGDSSWWRPKVSIGSLVVECHDVVALNNYLVNTETGAVWVLTQRTLASGTGREPVAIPYKFLYLLPEHNAVLDEGGQKIPVKERKTR